jgi:hypothetical protein
VVACKFLFPPSFYLTPIMIAIPLPNRPIFHFPLFDYSELGLNCVSRFSVNLPIPRDEITITGTPKVFLDNDTSSGKPVHRNFCGECGWCVFLSCPLLSSHYFPFPISPSFHPGAFKYCTASKPRAKLTFPSAILSTTEAESHKMAYVKGGLFTKQGIALPPCKMEVFWHRREEWEVQTEGVVVQ